MGRLYRYDMITADMAGAHGHPQKVVKELGLEIEYGEPVPIADCWMFRFKEPHTDDLPEYLVPIKETEATRKRFSR